VPRNAHSMSRISLGKRRVVTLLERFACLSSQGDRFGGRKKRIPSLPAFFLGPRGSPGENCVHVPHTCARTNACVRAGARLGSALGPAARSRAPEAKRAEPRPDGGRNVVVYGRSSPEGGEGRGRNLLIAAEEDMIDGLRRREVLSRPRTRSPAIYSSFSPSGRVFASAAVFRRKSNRATPSRGDDGRLRHRRLVAPLVVAHREGVGGRERARVKQAPRESAERKQAAVSRARRSPARSSVDGRRGDKSNAPSQTKTEAPRRRRRTIPSLVSPEWGGIFDHCSPRAL